MEQVLLTLPIHEISRLCSTNKEYAQICNNEDFWAAIYQRDFGNLGFLPSSWKVEYLKKIYPVPRVYRFGRNQTVKQMFGSFFATIILGQKLSEKITLRYLSDISRREFEKMSTSPIKDFGQGSSGFFLMKNGELFTYTGEDNPRKIEEVAFIMGGHGNEIDRDYQGDFVFGSRESPEFVQMSIGHAHGLFLDTDGEVWSMGFNTKGSGGIPPQYGTRVVLLPQAQAQAIQGQMPTVNSFIITARQLYVTPVHVFGLPEVTKVAAGGFSSFAIDEDGRIWGFGDSSQGQLGFVDPNPVYNPTLVPGFLPNYPDDVRIVEIFPSFDYTFFLNHDGTVFGCGNNAGKNLNLPEDRIYPVTRIPNLKDIRKICSGNNLNLALDKRGNVIVFGKDVTKMERLGSLPEDYLDPDYLEFAIGSRARHYSNLISLNRKYGIGRVIDIEAKQDGYLLLDEDHGLWVFGKNAKQSFNLDVSEENVLIPEKIPGVYPSMIRLAQNGVYVIAQQPITITRHFVEQYPKSFVRVGENTAEDAEGHLYLIQN